MPDDLMSLQAPLPISRSQSACRCMLGLLHLQQPGSPSHLRSAGADSGGCSAPFKVLAVAGCTGHALHPGATADSHLYPYSVPDWREGDFLLPTSAASPVCDHDCSQHMHIQQGPLQIASDSSMAYCCDRHARSRIRPLWLRSSADLLTS